MYILVGIGRGAIPPGTSLSIEPSCLLMIGGGYLLFWLYIHNPHSVSNSSIFVSRNMWNWSVDDGSWAVFYRGL